jgi:hypothetical protein
MGLWIETREKNVWIEVIEKVVCLDNFCVARIIIETLHTILEKAGFNLQTLEKHVERLGKLNKYDEYTFSIADGRLEVTIYDIEFDVVECSLEEGCMGYVTATIHLEGDDGAMKEIVKAVAKSMGIDKYLKCE